MELGCKDTPYAEENTSGRLKIKSLMVDGLHGDQIIKGSSKSVNEDNRAIIPILLLA